ncbi:MAG: hypothetical protein EPGJADBJ_05327 [Saprospiraceae bacterium]|nr:hypothetical protein [Saprospiraceae bacterium]
MMKTLSILAAIVLLLSLAHFACNPNCESLQGVELSTNTTLEGYEITIDAADRNALKGKKVFFGNMPVTPEFDDNGLMLVKVPAGISSETELRIEDLDCQDVIAFPFHVVGQSYFNSIDNFVPPIPIEVVFPTPNIPYPASVDQAWLSPDNPEYCLWFIMYKEKVVNSNGGTTYIPTIFINPDSSFEQATCCCKRSDPDLPYAQNRMGGIVDVEKNRIEVYINRTERGGDIEYFKGVFIDRSQVIRYANNTGILTCPPDGSTDPNCAVVNTCDGNVFVNFSPQLTQNNMMLLTSQKTGRQVVVYQLK